QPIRPDLGQRRDVLRVNLRQRRVAAAAKIVAVHRPVAAPVAGLRVGGGGLPTETRGGPGRPASRFALPRGAVPLCREGGGGWRRRGPWRLRRRRSGAWIA